MKQNDTMTRVRGTGAGGSSSVGPDEAHWCRMGKADCFQITPASTWSKTGVTKRNVIYALLWELNKHKLQTGLLDK